MSNVGLGEESRQPLLRVDGGLGAEEGLGQPLYGRVEQELQERITTAVYLSLAGNVVLLAAKCYAYFASWSMAVLASLIDSVIDLASQAVIAWADHQMSREDPQFPAGKARLETLSVLGCAAIMTMGALQVVSESAQQLIDGFVKGVLPELDMGPLMYGILGGATVLKLGLWALCFTLRHESGAALALAEDHINDVVSNLGAMATAAIAAQYRQKLWWADPLGGILISLYIMLRWAVITKRQVDKIVGRTAPADFLATVRDLVAMHHARCGVGFLRAYHVGQRLAVDVELTAPAGMTVGEAAFIAKELKSKIESLPEVECAGVFIVHRASGVFLPSPAPLIAPAGRCKPHSTTTTDVSELLGGLRTEPSSPAESPKEGTRTLPTTAIVLQPGSPVPELTPGPAAVAADVAIDMAPGAPRQLPERRIVSLPDMALLQAGGAGSLRRASHERRRQQQQQQQQPPALAQQLAWSRSLKDDPDRVLQSASLHSSDTATMMHSRLSRRSAEGPPSSPLAAAVGAAARAAADQVV